MIMLDTHIAVALYEGRTAGLSPKTKRDLDQGAASISPTVVIEIEMLHEIGRLRPNAATIVKSLAEDLNIRVATDPFTNVVLEAISFSFTRDPFDRLIVAHAALLKSPLITFDEDIRLHYKRATN
jgi:PIN domain nuclease of toxin-antitoxin system